ncbi:substrate-binding domain-containing protein [Paenibacillus sacheonensis]|uniref:Substrate-binding domain-containing protein n=1 Tax=Paenibacillus sacheonensis TaxID=742054 RepID=A0A7X4YRQ5_9BACL|nr:substrate-binding domain-containing protein [Paenibacillus sacheonensis]MBM7567560.1 ribose transport system substrate-binding protein [Paenibacillus sacheonensis]NBC71337.1 substrate-binding domain-containing protein [Paenibacillus sacheonensis]
MLNRIWNIGLLLLAAAFAGLLAAFALTALHTRELAGKLEPANESGQIGRVRVALISQELDNPFWRSVEQGARASAERSGMELAYMGPLRINPEEQARLFKKALLEGFDALLVQGLNDPTYAQLIAQASADGIPVVTIDADEPNSARIAYVGTDNRRAGEDMGRLVGRRAGGHGKVGILLGSEADNQRLRLEGFRGIAKTFPDLTVADVRFSNISRLQATEQAEDMLRKHPGMFAVIGFSALDGVGIAEAAKRAGTPGLQIFAFDDLASTRQAIANRRITAALVQQPVRMGEEAIALLHAYLQGRTVEKLHYTATTVLDGPGSAADGARGAGNGR